MRAIDVSDFFIAPLRAGYVQTSDTGGYVFAVFSREAIDRARSECLGNADRDYIAVLTGWTAFSRGIGRAFGADPVSKCYGRKFLVLQYRGLDV